MLTGKKKQTNRNPITPSSTVAFGMQPQPKVQEPQRRRLQSLGQPLAFLSRAQPTPEPLQRLLHPHRCHSVWQGSGRAQWEKSWEPADLGSSPSSAITCYVSPGKIPSYSRLQEPHP